MSSFNRWSSSAGFFSASMVMLMLAHAQPAEATYSFFGYVDSVQEDATSHNFVVRGWVCESYGCGTSPAIAVQVVDHTYFSGGGSHIAADNCWANVYRPDVGYHGFACVIDSDYKSGTDYWVRVAWKENPRFPFGFENVANEGDDESFMRNGFGEGYASVHLAAVSGDLTLSKAGVTIHTSDSLAGTIDSLIWNGREFVSNQAGGGGGASMQSAAAFGASSPEVGECFNPTEAGSWNTWGRSTSLLIATGGDLSNDLITQSHMAFYFPHGWSYGPDCSSTNNTTLTLAGNTNSINGAGDYELWKHVSINSNGLITYDTTFLNVPTWSGFNQFEATTGYLPASSTDPFNQFFNSTGGYASPQAPNGISRGPIIIATADGSYAIGISSEALDPSPSFYSNDTGNRHMGIFTSPDGAVKWTSVFQCDSAAAGSCIANAGNYYFRTMIVVGTLANVRSTVQGWPVP